MKNKALESINLLEIDYFNNFVSYEHKSNQNKL